MYLLIIFHTFCTMVSCLEFHFKSASVQQRMSVKWMPFPHALGTSSRPTENTLVWAHWYQSRANTACQTHLVQFDWPLGKPHKLKVQLTIVVVSLIGIVLKNGDYLMAVSEAWLLKYLKRAASHNVKKALLFDHLPCLDRVKSACARSHTLHTLWSTIGNLKHISLLVKVQGSQ